MSALCLFKMYIGAKCKSILNSIWYNFILKLIAKTECTVLMFFTRQSVCTIPPSQQLYIKKKLYKTTRYFRKCPLKSINYS